MYDSLSAPPNDPIGPAVTISGVAVFGRSTSSPTARLNYLYEAVDNLVMERGVHTFKTGVDFLYNHDTITYPANLCAAPTRSLRWPTSLPERTTRRATRRTLVFPLCNKTTPM